mmetsp:Transcript_31860/g.74481  ORF Transcript_31860/g.74481 Transcript_31860/m.74481 type:complete len:714 (-) Transcript_31860:64-2205(-)
MDPSTPSEIISKELADGKAGLSLGALDAVVAEVVAKFRDGHQQAALDQASSFAFAAKEELGEVHPVYINALATLAALLNQLGGTTEADVLLMEAEVLQEQLDSESKGNSGHLSPPEGNTEDVDLKSAPQALSDAATADGDEGSDVDLMGVATPRSSTSRGGSWGDAEMGSFFDSEDEEQDDDAIADAFEAKAITKLTLEVNAFVQKGQPQEAAHLLAAAEKLLEGSNDVSGVGKAALHTLWAGVLGAVGEEERAQALYDEAILCLEVEAMGPVEAADLSDPEFSSEGTSDTSLSCGDDDPVATQAAAEDEVLSNAEAQAIPHDREEQSSVSDEDKKLPQLQEAAAATESRSEEEARTAAEDNRLVPTPPPAAGTSGSSRPRRPAGGAVMQPAAKSEAATGKATDKPTRRIGGGFLAPAKPAGKAKSSSSSAPKEKKKASPQPEQREETSDLHEPVMLTEVETTSTNTTEPQAAEADTAQAAPLLPQQQQHDEICASHDVGEAKAKATEAPPRTAAEEEDEIKSTMSFADQLSGLMSFEKAADKLESTLKQIASPESPHRHTDLHVDCLVKYARILWWDADMEGAIDAFTAADEILVTRPGSTPTVQLQRAELWLQLAQVHKAWGDLEAADEHLSDTISSMGDLVQAGCEELLQGRSAREVLRDAQAALAQVCVQRKDFDRAEALYMLAFANEIGEKLSSSHAAKLGEPLLSSS